MKKYRAVVIGCGDRSRGHLKAFATMKDVDLVACCDLRPEARDARAGEFKIKGYADAEQMIRDIRPEIVNLVTMPTSRVELMSLVSDLKVPLCVVEKPIAVGVKDWKALCRLEASSKTKFAVSHQCRWQPNLVKCRQALDSGALGEIKFLDLSAGMSISGQGTHILNYGRYLNRDRYVTSVFGAAAGNKEMHEVHPGPETTAGYLIFDNGVRAFWNTGPTAPRCGDPKTFWKHVRVAAYADRGRVNWEEFGRWEIVSPRGTKTGSFGGMKTWEKNNIISQVDFHRAMFDWLKNPRKAPGTNLKDSLHEWKVVLALYTSVISRKPIEIEGFSPPEDLYERLAKALK